MTNTITLTDEQMKALQSGQAITIEPPKTNVEKWQPKDGEYYVNIHSAVPKYKLKTQLFGEVTRLAGLTRQNEEQAEQSAKALLLYARQLAWLSENNDGWVADWNHLGNFKHYVVYDCKKKLYKYGITNSVQIIPTVYMSQQNAEKLCDLLNSGIVEF